MQTYGLKYLRPISDIHLDFDVSVAGRPPWKPKGLPTDHLTALVLAGDIWHARKYLGYANQSWLAKRAQSFRYIIFVLGNHDYWGGAINHEADRVKEEIEKQGLKNVFLLENDTLVLEDVKFVGGTLWTDFNKQDPLTRMSWASTMTPDAKQIKLRRHFVGTDGATTQEYTRLTAHDMLKRHLDTRSYIFQNAVKDEKTRKLVVVTHMAPSEQSVHEKFNREKVANGYYFSELGNQIAYTDIDLWFHGHMHNQSDYMINNTRVICNPRGYEGYEVNDLFDENWLIEL